MAEKQQRLSIDEILSQVGEYGKFQILLNLILCIMKVPFGNILLIPYFSQHNPPWKCVRNSSLCTLKGMFDAKSDNYTFRCKIPRSEWEYTQPKGYSVVTQFDLYCDREPYGYLATSLVFLSWGLGAYLLGWTTDRYGRRLVMLIGSALMMIFMSAGAFSPNLWVYILFRVLTGFTLPGNIVNTFVIITEYTGPKRRPLAGRLQWTTACFGLIIMGITAMYIKSWKILTLTAIVPYFFIFAFYKFIPESPRWLQLKGRTNEVKDIFEKISHMNKKPLPDYEISELKNSSSQGCSHFLDIFRPTKIAIRSLIQGYLWMTTGLVYFGVSFATDDLGNDMYRDFIISNAVDILGNLVCIYLCNRIGRKKTTIWSMLIAGCSCVIVALARGPGKGLLALRVTNGMIGKFCSSMTFASIYVWSTELYPTVTRGAGMGYLQIAARIGSALAPWVAKWLMVFHNVLPFAVMGGSAFICSIMLLWLPETANEKTLETLDDQFFDSKSKDGLKMGIELEENVNFDCD